MEWELILFKSLIQDIQLVFILFYAYPIGSLYFLYEFFFQFSINAFLINCGNPTCKRIVAGYSKLHLPLPHSLQLLFDQVIFIA